MTTPAPVKAWAIEGPDGIDQKSVTGFSEEQAWNQFCHPSLIKQAYKNDPDYRCVTVIVTPEGGER